MQSSASVLSYSPPPLSQLKQRTLTVHLLHDVQSDGSGENRREGERARRLALGGPNGDGGTSSHYLEVCQ